jgi:hypothetical protein
LLSDGAFELLFKNGITPISLEEIPDTQFNDLYVIPSWHRHASDLAAHRGDAFSVIKYRRLIWGADSWANRVHGLSNIPIPDQIMHLAFQLESNSFAESFPRDFREIPRHVIRLDSIVKMYRQISLNDQKRHLETEVELDRSTLIVFLRDWEMDERYSPINVEAFVQECQQLILKNRNIKSVILKSSHGLTKHGVAWNIEQLLHRRFTEAGLATFSWSDVFREPGLSAGVEAQIFSGNFRNLGSVLVFDSTLDLLFQLTEFSTPEILRFSQESLFRIFKKRDALEMVKENLKIYQKASHFLNLGLSPIVEVNGSLFSKYIDRLYSNDLKETLLREREAHWSRIALDEDSH